MIRFVFTAHNAENAAFNREDILLTPLDLFRIANELKLSFKRIHRPICELYIGSDSHFPIIGWNPEFHQAVPLLKNRCSVHKAKPAMCAMFPIGRVIAFPEDETSSEAPVIEYFYMNPGCGTIPEHKRYANGLILLVFRLTILLHWMGDISDEF